jgi:DNA-binding MarR family transcriptional regulator
MDPHVPPRLAGLATWQLSVASARSHRLLQAQLSEVGASGYDYRILAVLGDLGPSSQADLGRGALLDRRDVTHTVRNLEARALVTRRADPTDGRQMLVELTAAGRSLLERLDRVLERVQAEVFSVLSDAERRSLTRLLEKLS